MKRPLVYFDNAASTPIPGEVVEVMQACMMEVYGNPSSLHEAGRRAKVAVEQSRRSVARCLNVKPSQVFFTSGGTEANNAILWGCCKDLGRKHFITSPLEHPSVLNTLEALVRYMDARIHFVDTGPDGHIDLDHLDELAGQYPGQVVSLMHANNEIGNLLPVKAVTEICRSRKMIFHSDTVQSIGKFQIDFKAMGLDFASGSAHKFHGPKGAGFMVVREGMTFKAFVNGGGQERNMRAGTENVCGIVGMARALEWMQDSMEENVFWVKNLRNILVRALRKEVPEVGFNGDALGSCLYTIVNLSLPARLDADMVLPRLDLEGICASSGSACSSGSAKSSHVLTALGADPGKPSLRISLSKNNSPDEVMYLVQVLKEITSA
jgi:cysteine desulfurase